MGRHPLKLKAEPQTEAELPLIRLRTCDFGIAVQLADAAVCVADGVGYVRAGIVEVRSIGGVEGLGPKLQLEFFRYRELPEQSQIDVGDTRPAQNEQTGGAVANRGHRSECRRIKI